MDSISTENEAALLSTDKKDEIWKPDVEIPLSPEMKAKMLEEIEQAAKEGKTITNEEAEVIARASTTTKSWGIRFPVRWIHVHKVPFSKTTHMLNPLYENREVKVSKDGTEVDPTVGEQLLNLFKKSGQSHRGRSSVRENDSRSNSEAGGSRRSSVAGDSSSLAPPQSQRSTSSRRSSIMSTRSTGSGGDRRASLDPSRTQGPGYKTMQSPLHAQRSQFGGGDGNQPQYRASSRHNTYGPHNNHGANTSQGPYSPDQYPDQQRPGWNPKPNYRSAGAGEYGQAPMGGAPIQGGFYHQDHNSNHRKSGPGGAGGKYGSPFHSPPPHSGYEPHQPYHSPHGPRRQQQQHYPGSYRSNIPSPGTDPSGNAGYGKHEASGTSPSNGSPNQQGAAAVQDQINHPSGGGSRIPHPSQTHPAGAHVMPSNQLGGPPVPPHPNIMVPGAGMVPGHPTSMPPIHGTSVGGGEGHVMEGLIPLIGYDGVAYAYIPAEEYHQSMYGYGYMPLDPHASEELDAETEAEQGQSLNSDGEITKEGEERENGAVYEAEAEVNFGAERSDHSAGEHQRSSDADSVKLPEAITTTGAVEDGSKGEKTGKGECEASAVAKEN
ncbi:hypothetical protein BGZ80_004482 [Entomortierella chlamydospora]|uniref:YTH domain-containing protein n=1 Tax=Entomortierella chlamydospora TaxID=101097 RepID=A0A9P6MMZ5_9FUNG|nr:hypothetical protein BGZ80_004482 [Entomortierella chlamydospora]